MPGMLLSALAVIVLLALRIWAHDDIVAAFQEPYGLWVYHGIGFLLYASVAIFLDRLIRYFYWRGYLARRRKRPTPALIEDIVTICLVVIALSIALSFEADMDVAAIVTAGGATAIVVGIALQTVIQDIFSGLSINLDGSYAIGDWLTVYSDHFDKPQYGRVIGITWRSTYLRLWDGRLLMIPNHMATANAVTNHCSPPGPKRLSFTFPIDYRVPAPRALALLTGEAFKAVRLSPRLARSPEPSVTIQRMTSDSTVFEVRFYADPEVIEPEDAITIVSSACHEAVIRIDMPTPVTQIEINQIPTREILQGTSEGRQALKLVPLFAAVLSETQFDSLNQDCRLVEFPAGKAFIKQGEGDTSMYVLLEGAAAVTITDARGEQQEVAVLAAGDFVGEMSLMTGAPRTATVTPLTELRVLEITKEAMEDLLRDSPELLEHFSRVMAQRQFELRDIAARSADIEEAQVDLLSRMTAFFARVFRT
jgi:small-conductance mechanosensitive channel/CRP-like cAMP-binding protein